MVELEKKIASMFSYVTVEPIIFCNFLAISFFRVVEHAGLYEVICIQNYKDDYVVDCKNISGNHEVEDLVQKKAATVNMYLSLGYLIPAIISDLYMGAMADRNGRKINILIGLAGLIIAAFPYTIVLTFPQTTLMILLAANIIAGATGYIAIVMISSLAYLADIVLDKSKLTVRMAQSFVYLQAGIAIGSFAVGPMIRISSYSYVILLVIIILAIGFFYTIFRLKQIPPLVYRQMLLEKKAKKQGSNAVSKVQKTTAANKRLKEVKQQNYGEDFKENIKTIIKTYKELYVTYTRPRVGHRRCYLSLFALVYLLYFISELGLLHGPVINLFVFNRPFHWTAAELGYWKGTQATVLLLGNFFGSWIMKTVLKLKDTTVVLICLSSVTAQLVLMAVSRTSWLLYLAIVVGMFGNLSIATMKSFVAKLVDPDEVGKAFTAQGVTADIAFVCSSIFLNNIYTATVTIFAGIVFFFAASLLIICFCIVLWIHLDKAKIEPDDNPDAVHPEIKSITVIRM